MGMQNGVATVENSVVVVQKLTRRGLPWRSRGYDSAPPMQGAWVPSLIAELRTYMPRGMAKKTQKNPQTNKET